MGLAAAGNANEHNSKGRNRMKIVHYLSSVTRSAGGLYYSVSGLSKAQAKLGHDVTVIGGADQHALEDLGQWDGLTLKTHSYASQGYGFDRRVPGMIAASQPDILHVHGIWSAASIYGLIAARRGIATFVSPRGMLDPWILKRKSVVKKAHALLLERPLLKRSVTHALNISEHDSINRFMAPTAAKIVTVPNGVTLGTVDVAARRSGTLYLGRLHEKKQVLELIAAWTANEALNGTTLTIAGWGAPEYEAKVSAACREAQNVDFVGSAYGDDKRRLLEAASFFILPSLSEGLPMAVLEAMGAAVIPIITDECNLPELFAQGSAIRIATDFSDFSTVTSQMMGYSDKEVQALRGTVAQSIKAYSWDSLATTMLEHYCACLPR